MDMAHPRPPPEFYLDLGALLFGYSVACIFYGCSTIQTFIYYRVSPRDALWVKVLIFATWVFESIHTVLLAACAYIIFIRDADQISTIVKAKWALSAIIYITCVIEFAVRALFINRIWKLSKGNRPATILLCILSLAVLASSLLWGIQISHLQSMTDIRHKGRFIYTTFSLALFTDVLMTGGQCVLLWRNRTGFTASDSIVRRLVMYILNTGMLVCVVTIAVLIAYGASQALIFVGIYLALPKIFFNSLLASLNIRQLIFADSEAPREDVRAGLPAPGARGVAGKADLVSSLAVHVETTTLHKVDDGYAMVPRVGRRWRPDNAVWLPMQARCDGAGVEVDCTDENTEIHRESSTIWHIDSDSGIETRAF